MSILKSDEIQNKKDNYGVQQEFFSSYGSYNDIVNILDELIQADPDLAANYASEITKYSEDELNKLVIGIIKKKQDYLKDKKDQKIRQPFSLSRQKQNWDNYYKQFFQNRQNSWMYLSDVLPGQIGSSKEFQQQLLQALLYLNLNDKIFFNSEQGQIQRLDKPNATGTGGQQVNMRVLVELIKLYTPFVKSITDLEEQQSGLRVLQHRPEYNILKKIITGLNHKKVEQRRLKQISQLSKPPQKNLNSLQQKLTRKLNLYVLQPKYKAFVANKASQNGGFLKKMLNKPNDDLAKEPLLKKNLIANTSYNKNKFAVNLQQNLTFVPKKIQDEFKTVVNNENLSMDDLSRLNPKLKKRHLG